MGGSCGASVTLLIGCVIICWCCVDVNGCVEEERRALLDIKHSLDSVGYDPFMLENWVGGGDCCNWTGVECDAYRAVSKIDLSFVRLGFSQEWYPNASLFGQFTELKEIDLYYNGIAGWVNPQDIWHLQKVQLLDLTHNNLNDESIARLIVPWIHNLTSLFELDLGWNNLKEIRWISNITSLSSLDLSSTQIKDFSDLCQLQDLQVLDLSYNSMKGNIDSCLKRSIPLSLFNNSDIMLLDIRKNFFSGPIPNSFQYLENIESLDLSNNNLSGEIPSQLDQLHSLSVFRVSYNNLSGFIPYNIQFCTFNKSSFEGNPCLSGELLIEKKCWSMHGTSQTYHDSSDGDHEDTLKAIDNDVIFYSFVAASFAIGFWGVIAVLAFNKNGRIKFFMAVDYFLYARMDV
ncbi:hypothetical protein QJS10_CPB19g01255 [Acorus calamus]|uniref:Leucine-rich repeat-containing N-terminal plant-type domain-containing protein n=1 Tax=Acorus calamus TaxID=4465 RepID=A0AAV9CHP3_ACOCL|nr:hypothetical protein QJS10_CPB19g01255 [Acorus calamus]